MAKNPRNPVPRMDTTCPSTRPVLGVTVMVGLASV